MTNDETIESPVRAGRTRRDVHIDIVIAFVLIAAVAAIALNAVLEFSGGTSTSVNWALFGVFAALLLLGETTPASWMQMPNGGVITMSWTFAFSLVLLGSPTGAVIVLALATLIGEFRTNNDGRRRLFNTAQVSLALAFGGLTLFAFGISEPLTGQGSVPLASGLAIVCSGLVIFISNGAIVCYIISVSQGERFMRTMRNGFALSISADGALLALAPIFLVSLQFSPMMAPLLGIAAAIVYRSAAHALARAHDANHDTLTELRNRRAFITDFDRLLADRLDSHTATVVLIDLDGFKGINDRLGHQAGDGVLRTFAERLSGAFPRGSIVARLGGDEFAVVVPDDGDNTLDWAAVHRTLVAPMTIDGLALTVGASIGIAACPLHGTDSTELLHAADIAMYRAKQFQTGVEHHDATAPAKLGRRTMLRAFSEAIGTDQLTIRYEPLTHLRDRSLVTVATKLHWMHPDQGAMDPAEVINFATQSEVSRQATDFTVEQAIRDITVLDDRSIHVAIAVPGCVLHDPHFAKKTLSTLHRLEFRPDRLEFEIAERSLEDDPERSRSTLAELHDAGVRIALSGFGAGHASLLALRRFPVDRLTIEAAFTGGMLHHVEDRAIVQSAIDLAHQLGIAATAGDVDDDALWLELTAMGCDIVRGSVVGGAMTIPELSAWIATPGHGPTGAEPDRAPQRRPVLR